MFLKKVADLLFCKIFYRVKFEGTENIKINENYVYVANHVSAMDALWLWSNIKNLAIMAKEELFKFKPFGAFLKYEGVFPIARGKKDFSHVYQAVKLIKGKKDLLIFPEGTRNARKKGVNAKNGAVYIASAGNVKILPIHITESFRLFGKIRIVYGKPIELNLTKEEMKDKNRLSEVTKSIMETIYNMGDKNGR